MSRDPFWKYGTRRKDMETKSYVYLNCNFCNQLITGGIYRLKEHLAGSHRNAKPCPNATPEARNEALAYFKNAHEKKERKQQMFDDIVQSGPRYGSHSGSNTTNEMGKRDVRGPMDRFVVHSGEDTEGTATNTNTSPEVLPPNPKEARRLVCNDIGRFFFENGLAFHAVDSLSFACMCISIANYGRGLKPPSRNDMGTWILKDKVKNTDVYVDEIRKTWVQTGVSILSDGWKDMQGRSLINILINNPYGIVFLKSVDASDAVKDAKMLFKLLDEIVEEIGEELVVQVVTDNASNYKAAGKLLMDKRKRLYWTSCDAHCIDLMLEKIVELPQHKNDLLKAKKVSNFIYNHGFVLALMRKFTNRELVRPAVTRFAIAFLTLESMVVSKQPLEAMFTSKEWATSSWASKSEGKAIKKIVLSDNTFWPSVMYALNTTKPLVKVLRMVDGEKMPAMRFIYGVMDAAKEEIASNLGNETAKYKEIWEIIDAKWEAQLHRELHAAAYFLNPRHQYSSNFSMNILIKKGLMSCMERLIPPESLTNADLQLDAFRMMEGLFGRRQAIDTYQSRSPAN